MTSYYSPEGGLPPQTSLMTGRARFTQSYAVIPRGVFSDIVTSLLPDWRETRLWLIARPMSGFSETFSHYVMEVAPGGGSDEPEPDPGAEAVIFVTEGQIWLSIDGQEHELAPGGYAYLPPEMLLAGAQRLGSTDKVSLGCASCMNLRRGLPRPPHLLPTRPILRARRCRAQMAAGRQRAL